MFKKACGNKKALCKLGYSKEPGLGSRSNIHYLRYNEPVNNTTKQRKESEEEGRERK